MKPENRPLLCLWYGLCAFIIGLIGIISLCQFFYYLSGIKASFLRLSIPYYYIPIHSQIQLCRMAGNYLTYAIGILLFIPWSLMMINRARLYAIRANTLELSDIPISFPYVLYLRSFCTQSVTSKIIKNTFYTEEEILVNSLSPIGKTVAIGCPSDDIPPLGGYRIYVSDEEWQNTVRRLSKDAMLTALRIGETEGLSWEIEYTLINIPDLQKLIFLIPDIQKTNLTFFARLENALRKNRPNDVQITPCYFNKQGWGSVSSIIYFEKKENGSDNNPTYIMKQSLIPRRTIWNFFGNLSPAFQKAMFPVYEQFGKLSSMKKLCNAFFTYCFYYIFLIILICSLYSNLMPKPERPNTSVQYTQAIHEAEQKNPELAKILADEALANQNSFILLHSAMGFKYLSDEHLIEFIALDIKVSEIWTANKLGIDNAIAQLPKKDAIKYNNYLMKSVLMALDLEKPEYTLVQTPEEFQNRLSEVRSSLTEEQNKVVNDFLTSGVEYTWKQNLDYIKFICNLPDKSIKALLLRGYSIMKYREVDQ